MSLRLQEIHDWLHQELGPGDFTLTPASSDASFRRYFRVHAKGYSRIVMDAPPENEDCRPFVRVADNLLRAGLNVPRVQASDLARGFLLLSDLGDTHYLAALECENAQQLYDDALDALLRIQISAGAADMPDYDETRLREEMSLFPDWFLDRHLGISPSAKQRSVFEAAFSFLCASAAEQPFVFVHRDYHSRNLMFVEGQNPGILDFQDAVRGPITYDLVSLLRDVYIRWPDAQIEAWLSRYFERAADAGLVSTADSQSWVRWFDLMGVQRHLKIAGIFARLYHRDGKPGYLRDIPLTLDYLLAVADKYAELAELCALLKRFEIVAGLEQRNRAVFRDLEETA